MMQSARHRPPRQTTITSGRSPGFRVVRLNLLSESPSHVIRHSGRDDSPILDYRCGGSVGIDITENMSLVMSHQLLVSLYQIGIWLST